MSHPVDHPPEVQTRIEQLLRQTLWGMVAVYACFSVGWIVLLFSERTALAASLMLAPSVPYLAFTLARDHEILRMGFSRRRAYPADWRLEFKDRETALFKLFTTFWTFAFFAWAFLKYGPFVRS